MTTPATTTAPPTMTYWYKELASNTFYIAGKPLEVEFLDGNRGVVSLPSTDSQVPALEQAAKDQIGGIVKISQDEYEKKRLRYPYKARRQEDLLEVAPRADRPMGKAFRPPPPKESPESPVQPVNAPPAPESATNEPPQRPPEQPDFTAKFAPKTARAGVVKPPEPSPV